MSDADIPNEEMPDDERSSDETQDGEQNEGQDDQEVAFSLQDLGRAYAKAVGLTPDEAELEPPPSNVPEPDDLNACPISPQTIIESILFVGAPDDEKLSSRKIAAMLRDVSPKEVTQTVKELNLQYEKENAAYRIKSDRNNIEMVLAEEFNEVRERFYGEIRSAKLSQGAIDILAIVAYNQPVGEPKIEQIRGRPCGSILRQLVKRELLSVTESAEKKRAREFRTTDRFLQLFGLDSLEDLPQAHESMISDMTD